MNVLFLCTGNSCRSQMAEGFAKSMHAPTHAFYSAGTIKTSLNPRAVLVMKEAGVDIEDHTSKTISDLPDVSFDLVITVCSAAHETCPVLPGANIQHIGFDDPPHLTQDMTDEAEILNVYRRVRDEIKSMVEGMDLSGGAHA